MALNIPKLVQKGIKIIEDTAGSIRVKAMHAPVIGHNAYGPIYSTTPTEVQAMMEISSERVVGQDNVEKVSAAVFDFFEPMDIKERDKLTVGDVTNVVIKVGGLVDPTNNKPFNPRVWTRGSF